MNIYRILDESDKCLWQAESMAAALQLAEDAYIAEAEIPADEQHENREYYRNELLQSCELIGELANPVAVGGQ